MSTRTFVESRQQSGERQNAAREPRADLLEIGVLEHQVKTDATVVHGWATTLDENWDALSDEQKHEAVQIIRRRAASLAEAARQSLLEAAHSWPAATPGPVVRHDIARRVRQIAEEMTTAATGHVVHYEGPSSLLCRVDIAAVERAVQQLIENAAKYSVAGTEIAVTLELDAGAIAIEVVDEGVGIPADGDLFDPFVRHSSTDDGSGLGLFMVRAAVEAIGGTVTARRNPRWGSTFRIEVPAR